MGRTLKRVPMDFSAPVGEPWSGYLGPDWRDCPDDQCSNGYTVTAAWVGVLAHLLLMVGEAAAEGRLHPWLRELPLGPGKVPSAQAVELTTGLAGRPPSSMGHDSLDQVHAVAAIGRAAGMLDGWEICPTCNGHAMHPDDVAPSEAWECTEPPEGDGFQLWETTSEGSPITPVFATIEELCAYAADNCTTFGRTRATADEWRRMLDNNFVAAEYRAADGTRVVFI